MDEEKVCRIKNLTLEEKVCRDMNLTLKEEFAGGVNDEGEEAVCLGAPFVVPLVVALCVLALVATCWN
jgi:hypothetical protein